MMPAQLGCRKDALVDARVTQQHSKPRVKSWHNASAPAASTNAFLEYVVSMGNSALSRRLDATRLRSQPRFQPRQKDTTP